MLFFSSSLKSAKKLSMAVLLHLNLMDGYMPLISRANTVYPPQNIQVFIKALGAFCVVFSLLGGSEIVQISELFIPVIYSRALFYSHTTKFMLALHCYIQR